MAGVDLDPLFVRALRLLHSKTKESEQQLKALLDESIRQRKAGIPVSIPTPLVTSVPGVSSAKKQRLEVGGNTRFSSHSMTPSPTTSVPVEESDDMDLDFQSLNDCTCCICKSFNQENGNKLMECHTCQNLYHQECHSPVITDQEANDPRLVWNCSNCSATIQQPAVAAPKPPTTTGSSTKSSTSLKSSGSSSKSGSNPSSRTVSSSSKDGLKRSESSKSQSTGSKASSSSNSSSRGSANVPSTTSGSTLATADKRLQMMKKKAAAASSTSVSSAKKGK